MAGPSLGQIAASMTGLVLAEKLVLELLLPPWVPMLEAYEATMGRAAFLLASGALTSVISFWGIGSLMALPAIFHIERWKIQPNRNMEMRALLQAMPLILVNFTISTVMVPLVLLACLPESAFDYRSLPEVGALVRDVSVWFACEEVIFFYVHRWLHENKKMYGAIHKLHHTWTAPISLVAIYCHPLEHIFSNIAPLLAGPIICGSHVASVGVFIFLGLVHTCAVHSGYWVCDDNGLHDEHHNKFNVNYGVVGVMDWLYGSYQLPSGAAGAGEEKATPSPAAAPKHTKRE